MKLSTLLDHITGKHRYTTAEDVRNTFGDYHNVLQWLAAFLIEERRGANAYIIDACALVETQTPDFHDWLVHWAARATVRHTLQSQRERIAELAPGYEKEPAIHLDHPPLSIAQFQALIRNSEQIHARLDVLCRFVLIIRGIAKESPDDVAGELGISRSAVDGAYCVGFDLLSGASRI